MATIIYSRTALLGIINSMFVVPRIDYKIWKTLRVCGIANLYACYGCRAEALKHLLLASKGTILS